MKKALIFLFLLGAYSLVLGQGFSETKNDSLGEALRAQVRSARYDTARISPLRRLARLYQRQGRADSAYGLLKQGLRLAKQSQDPQYLGLMYYEMGEFYYHRKQFTKYFTAVQKAVYFFQKAHQVVAASRAMYNLAEQYAVNFEQAKSVEQCQRNLAYARQTGYYELASYSYALLYTIHINFGQKKKAFADLIEMKRMAERNPTAENKYLAFMNSAEWYDNQQDYKRALIYYKRISAIDLKNGDPLAIVESYHCIAADLIKLNEHAKAEVYLDKGMRVIEKYKPISANFYVTLAHLREAQNRWPEAREAASIALGNARKTYQPFIIQSSLEVLARIQEKQGKYREALLTTHQLKAMTDSIDEISHIRAINDIESRFVLEKKEKDIKMLRQESLIQQQATENDQQQKTLYIALAAGLALLLLLMSWVVRQDRRRLHSLNEQKTEIMAQAKRLEELNQVKSKLFTLIGHDLRSPVINLKLIVDDLIQKREVTEWQTMNQTTQLQGTINSLYYTLDNLLHWAATQQKGISVHREEVSPRELFIETLELFEGMIRQKNIRVGIDIPDETKVMADEGQLQVVFRNILHNALKFTPIGGSVDITLDDCSTAETVLRIADSGVGMEPRKVLQTAGTLGEKGTGLGLRVCKEFVEQNGGRLEIDSAPGQGTIVRLIFASMEYPVAKVIVR